MPLLTLQLGRQNYTLACGEGEETKLKACAERLNTRIDGIFSQLGNKGSDPQIMAMVALMMEEEITQLRDQERERITSQEKIVEQAKSADLRVSEVAARFEKERQDQEEALASAMHSLAEYVERLADKLEKAYKP